MSTARKGELNYFYDSKRFGELNPFYGKKHTEETKNIIKSKRANQIYTTKTKKLMSDRATKSKWFNVN